MNPQTTIFNHVPRILCCSLLFLLTLSSTAQNKKDVPSIQPTIAAPVVADNIHEIKFSSQGQDVKMSYLYEKGQKPRNRTVLLLHGKNFNMQYWDSTMAALLHVGFDVVVPDQIGFGNSSVPENYQYSFQQLAMNTKILLDSLDLEKVIVVGHSMGGMLAVRFALMYPTYVEQLILENPIGLEDWKTMTPYSPIDELYADEIVKTPEVAKQYMISNYFHGTWKNEYDSLLNLPRKFYSSPEWQTYARTMALTSDMIFTQPVWYELNLLKVPTLLIIGTLDKTALGKDRATPETASQMGNYAQLGKKAAQMIPGAQLIELTSGHIPHIENFSLFKEKLLHQLNITQPDPRKQE